MLHPIDVDLDVHKAIEQARLSFDEQPNGILRRMLGIGRANSNHRNGTRAEPPKPIGSHPEEGKEFRHGNRRLMLPNGTRLRADYKGRTFEGEIIAGDFIVSGARYSSFSPALIGEVKRVIGKTVSLNGWIYWHFQRPGSSRWKLASAESEQS